MTKLVAEILLDGSLEYVKNVIDGFVRDGLIITEDYALLLPGEIWDPGSIHSLAMKEYPELNSHERGVWSVGQSAFIAEVRAKHGGHERTSLKWLAVKAIVFKDSMALFDWTYLVAGLRKREMILQADNLIDYEGYNLIWTDLARIEQKMLDGERPMLPDEETWRRKMAESLKDQECPLCRERAHEDPYDDYDSIGCPGKINDGECRLHNNTQLAWYVLERSSHSWDSQFEEIQRLQEYSVEQATSMYFGEKDATESVQASPVRPREDTPAKWHGKGKPPQTINEKIAAAKAWDAIPREDRPRLADWLLENFGSDPATEEPLVIESTFHGWRKYLKSDGEPVADT